MSVCVFYSYMYVPVLPKLQPSAVVPVCVCVCVCACVYKRYVYNTHMCVGINTTTTVGGPLSTWNNNTHHNNQCSISETGMQYSCSVYYCSVKHAQED